PTTAGDPRREPAATGATKRRRPVPRTGGDRRQELAATGVDNQQRPAPRRQGLGRDGKAAAPHVGETGRARSASPTNPREHSACPRRVAPSSVWALGGLSVPPPLLRALGVPP